jgi:hypothetical protein
MHSESPEKNGLKIQLGTKGGRLFGEAMLNGFDNKIRLPIAGFRRLQIEVYTLTVDQY